MDSQNFPQKLYDQALRFLSFRPRSEYELVEYFKRKKATEKDSNIVLKLLRELHLVNDYEFAKWWIEQRNEFRPKGKQLLILELRKKGITKELIDQVLEETTTDRSEWEKAYAVGVKKTASFKKLEKKDFVLKLSQFLGRRGFSFRIIRSVVDEIAKKEYNTP